MATYAEKLKDPRWQKKRLEILERDGWKCQFCGAKDKTLHVHHWTYVRNREPWDYEGELLITLCYECHEKESLRSDFEDLVLYILRRGNLSHINVKGVAKAMLFVTLGHSIAFVPGEQLPTDGHGRVRYRIEVAINNDIWDAYENIRAGLSERGDGEGI